MGNDTSFTKFAFSSPTPIVNFFLEKAWAEKKNMTTMKLLKLLYFAYGFWLAIFKEKLFSESLQAWQYGPVIPSIYHEFKRFGAYPIKVGEYSKQFDPYHDDDAQEVFLDKCGSGDIKLIDFLNKIWGIYKDYSANQLVDLTHKDGTPWSKVYNSKERFIKIPDDSVYDYFEYLLSKDLEG